jgi:hypothetical protein
MDACLITLIVGIIIFVIGIVLIIKITRRPKLLLTVSNRNSTSYRQEVLNKLANKGYLIKEKENGNIFVQKDNFSATTLVFRQNGLNVDVLYIHTNSNLILILFVIFIITIWLIAIILALIADSKSKSFREDELKPLLGGYDKVRRCPNCGRPIPMDARFCPYCTKSIS